MDYSKLEPIVYRGLKVLNSLESWLVLCNKIIINANDTYISLSKRALISLRGDKKGSSNTNDDENK